MAGLDTNVQDAPAPALRNLLEDALASGLPEVPRLSYAHTSVRFAIAGQGALATLLLDRTPPVVAGPDEPAEVEIELASADARRFAGGNLPMPAAVISGTAHTRGPVRKYLEVDPILRRLLSLRHPATSNGAHHARTGGAAADRSALDPSLLAIETRALHKSFGVHRVLTGVDLTVPEGTIAVVLGPSGTGKSVLLKHIIGLLRADSGDVLIRGRPYSRMSRSEMLALRTEIGVMFQDGALFTTMTVYDNVAFPLRQHTDLGEREIREVVLEHLASVGLGHAVDLLPHQLSGGMRKRAGLARALAMDPAIVLCDEPDSGLDPVRTSLLADLLIEQHGRVGGTMLVITHNVALARRISHHISILWHGRVLEAGITEEILGSDTAFVQQFLAGKADGPLGMD
ncbi:MAG TPA: ATP-binding cassette domain-containing protein [Solirubrobacteraceae bacterium]|nr:ATP-binding cassette domain-containing protein [Solirubrobacteraceae bacterium]